MRDIRNKQTWSRKVIGRDPLRHGGRNGHLKRITFAGYIEASTNHPSVCNFTTAAIISFTESTSLSSIRENRIWVDQPCY